MMKLNNSNNAHFLVKFLKLKPAYFARMRYPEYLEKMPIDEKAILLESQQGLDVDGNIFYMAKELLSNEQYKDYKLYLVGKDSAVTRKIKKRLSGFPGDRYSILKLNSNQYFKMLASAKYLINDNTFLDYFIKREGQVYLNLWHGTPLKRLGRMDRNMCHTIGNAQKNLLWADYLLFPNDFTRDRIIEDYMIDNLSNARILMSGYPRNEAFFDENDRRALLKELGLESYKIYGFLPTWRRNATDLQAHINKLDGLLNNDEIVFIKLHPVARQSVSFNGLKHVREWPQEIETYRFLNLCDKLITDFSSVFFDYAISRRKIILFALDEEGYLSDRGLYFSLEEMPFTKVYNENQLVKELRSTRMYDDSAFLNEFCKYESADAARKLCDRVILGVETDIEEQAVPNNGRKNVLMYCGNLAPNGITSALSGILDGINLEEYNYYLNFNSTYVAAYRKRVEDLPAGVKYISVVGKMNASFKEKMAIILYQNKLISWDKFWKVAERAYIRDYSRIFTNVHFDTVIQYTGYEYKKILSYAIMPTENVIFVHSDMEREIATRGNQRREVLEFAYNKYSKVVSVSGMAEASAKRMAGDTAADFRIISNVINQNKIQTAAKEKVLFNENTRSNVTQERLQEILESKSFKFVNVGRFSKEKGHERLIDAFDRYWTENKNSYLIIVGGNQKNGLYDEIENHYLRNLKCANNVVVIMNVDNPHPIVNSCDGFILSSFYEGQGLSVMEADILSIPVVCVDIDGPRDFLKENNGCIVDNSEDGILEGMRLLAEGKVACLENNGSRTDYSRYSNKSIQQFEELVQTCVEKTNKKAVIAFTREPQLGLTKTRMMPYYTAEQCVALHTAFLKDIKAQLDILGDDADVIVCYSTSSGTEILNGIFGNSCKYIPQRGRDIWEKMDNALADSFDLGYEKVVLIGTDIPEFSAEDAEAAFDILDRKDIAIGTSEDKGYYLIGMNAVHREIFDVAGETDGLSELISAAEGNALSFDYVSSHCDMDNKDDINGLRRRYRSLGQHVPGNTERFVGDNIKISIVVPIYNEAEIIEAFQDRLAEYAEDAEIIFVDGGSDDGCTELIRGEYKLLRSELGRGRQMNLGARECTGDIILFLHCDSYFPEDFIRQIRETFRKSNYACFGVSFDSRNIFMWTNQNISNRRAWTKGLPFGDQGIAIDRDLFFEVGAFPDLPIMEDYEFGKKMRSLGYYPDRIEGKIETSDRRYGKGTFGILRTEYRMWRLRRLYDRGTDIETIRGLYNRINL